MFILLQKLQKKYGWVSLAGLFYCKLLIYRQKADILKMSG